MVRSSQHQFTTVQSTLHLQQTSSNDAGNLSFAASGQGEKNLGEISGKKECQIFKNLLLFLSLIWRYELKMHKIHNQTEDL